MLEASHPIYHPEAAVHQVEAAVRQRNQAGVAVAEGRRIQVEEVVEEDRQIQALDVEAAHHHQIQALEAEVEAHHHKTQA